MHNVDSKTAGVICLDRTENIQHWLPPVVVIKTVERQRCWPGLCVFNFSCWESNIIVLLISRRTFLHFKSPTREREREHRHGLLHVEHFSINCHDFSPGSWKW